jgi:hypothetical protein
MTLLWVDNHDRYKSLDMVVHDKLMSFVNGYANVFQGVENGVICWIQDKFVLHLESIQCTTHHTNLMVQILFQIPIVRPIKDLLLVLLFLLFL